MGELRIPMRREGDVKIEWNKYESASVEIARKAYEEFMDSFTTKETKGHAYSVTKLGLKGKEIFDFDEDAERIILVSPVGGG